MVDAVELGQWSEISVLVDEPVDLDPDCRLKVALAWRESR
jgi:hypothetical protein